MTVPSRDDAEQRRAVEAVALEHGARITATLIRLCDGDFQLAEDVFQEALITALERWPADGVPASPDAWIITTARRKAIDQLRCGQTLRRRQEIRDARIPYRVTPEHELPDRLDGVHLQRRLRLERR